MSGHDDYEILHRERIIVYNKLMGLGGEIEWAGNVFQLGVLFPQQVGNWEVMMRIHFRSVLYMLSSHDDRE